MRQEFEMSEEQLKKILDASKPTPVMYLSSGQLMGNTPQGNANRAWKSLGEEMGFIWNTVEPSPGKGDRFFSAEPTEKNKGEKKGDAKEMAALKTRVRKYY